MIVALSGCTSATNDPPELTISEDTRVRLAEALQASGDIASATAALQGPSVQEVAKKADPLAHATALIATGKVDQGLGEAKKVLAAHNDDPSLALAVGRLALEAGRLTEAGDVYRQCLLRHPDNVEALNGKGVVLAQLGDLDGAAGAFRQALARRARDVPARNNLALVMALSGKTDVALSMLEELNRTDGSPQVKATLDLARAIRF